MSLPASIAYRSFCASGRIVERCVGELVREKQAQFACQIAVNSSTCIKTAKMRGIYTQQAVLQPLIAGVPNIREAFPRDLTGVLHSSE